MMRKLVVIPIRFAVPILLAICQPIYAAAPAPPWLARVNMYRAMDQLAPIANDPALTAGAQNHAVYLIKNFSRRVRDGSCKLGRYQQRVAQQASLHHSRTQCGAALRG